MSVSWGEAREASIAQLTRMSEKQLDQFFNHLSLVEASKLNLFMSEASRQQKESQFFKRFVERLKERSIELLTGV